MLLVYARMIEVGWMQRRVMEGDVGRSRAGAAGCCRVRVAGVYCTAWGVGGGAAGRCRLACCSIRRLPLASILLFFLAEDKKQCEYWQYKYNVDINAATALTVYSAATPARPSFRIQ